ncbi:HAD family hydrolase [Dorea acetigenes]|uniref:HAD family hydrolase n=1 Tax=Dorea acetigenes TaxID=2981787 RepID=A0ABT2RJ51_9FIRM|nr:HAD family hydrolase [Dorea acetigenes]MCB6416510.1 HAD family hydrolase [Faecalimonas umbilicata]MCU6685366.1 HAD family hydrolase [Dorea acetigenes]SCI45112.1 Phosphoglycolate phosphatase [uncultured Clostridium sp.]
MRACIFDLDGTLTNTLESLTYSVNETLKEMGLRTISSEQCRQFVGNGARCLMKRALQVSGDENAGRLEEGMKVYGRIFGANCTYHVTPYEGIPEMLDELKKRGMKLGVLSNKPHGQTVDVAEKIFGSGMFDEIQGQSESLARKPDPAGVFYLLEKMQISKEECLYIGDSEVDIATGSAAGVKSVGVSWGFRSRETLKEAGAQIIIDVPQELLQYV